MNISVLPNDVKREIGSFLREGEVGTLMLVSRAWRAVLRDHSDRVERWNSLWEMIVNRTRVGNDRELKRNIREISSELNRCNTSLNKIECLYNHLVSKISGNYDLNVIRSESRGSLEFFEILARCAKASQRNREAAIGFNQIFNRVPLGTVAVATIILVIALLYEEISKQV